MERTACPRHEDVARLESRFRGQRQPRRKCLDFFWHKLVAPDGTHLQYGALTGRRQAILSSGTLPRFNRQQHVARSNPVGYLAFQVADQYFPSLAGGSNDRGGAEAYFVDRCHEVDDAPLLVHVREVDDDIEQTGLVHPLPPAADPPRLVGHALPERAPRRQQSQKFRRHDRPVGRVGRKLRRQDVAVESPRHDADGAFPRLELAHHELTGPQNVEVLVARLRPAQVLSCEKAPAEAVDTRELVPAGWGDGHPLDIKCHDLAEGNLTHSRRLSSAPRGAPPPCGGRPAQLRVAPRPRQRSQPPQPNPSRTG